MLLLDLPPVALMLEQAAVANISSGNGSGAGGGGEDNCTAFDVTPVTMSKAETILNLVCLSQGLPINLLIAIVISRNRRLHNPRNTFWLGIIALNLLTILMSVFKMVTVNFDPEGEGYICLAFSFLTGIPYTILLCVMLLATLDRYVAITYPLYHRKRVTVRRVVIILILCFFSVATLLSLPFLFGWVPLKCGFNLTLGKWTMLMRSLLVTLCIGAQVKVYLQTKKYLRMHEEQQLKQKQSIPMKVLNNESTAGGADNHQRSINNSSILLAKNNNNKFFVHRGDNKTVSKLELEASLTLVIGVLSLCAVTAPMFITYFSVSICQYFGGKCAYLVSIVPYVRQAALIHSVYGPLIYIARSGEFHSAVRKMLRPKRRLSGEFL